MADTPKAPAKPQPIEPGTIFIKNPSGAVHDIEATHPAIDLAKKGDGGWRLASDDEIREYCERHNLVAPGSDAKAEAESPSATPAAAEFAQASGVDLSTVKGTGADGTITKADVEAAAKKA